jgi:integrase/recombinase XerD
MRLNEAVQRFGPALVIEVAPRTCEWYLQKLAGLMAFVGAECEVETIRTDTLRVWLADLARQAERRTNHPTRPTREGGLSPYTLAGYVRTMRRFFGWLYEEEHLEDNPAARLKLPKLPKEPPKAVAPNDLDLLLEAAWASGDRDYALVCFLADTGCRVGGLASLTLDALDLDAGEATVWEKGEKTRDVFLVPMTVAALRRWRRGHEDAGPRVFVGKRGPLTTNGVYQVLKRLGDKTGVQGRFKPPRLSAQLRAGVPAARRGSEQAIGDMGHDEALITMKFYARWRGEEIKSAHLQFSPLAARSQLD